MSGRATPFEKTGFCQDKCAGQIEPNRRARVLCNLSQSKNPGS
jgi:hypothetical protein